MRVLKFAARVTFEGFTYQEGDAVEVEDRLAAKILDTFRAGEVYADQFGSVEVEPSTSPEIEPPTSAEADEAETQAPVKGGRGKGKR